MAASCFGGDKIEREGGRADNAEWNEGNGESVVPMVGVIAGDSEYEVSGQRLVGKNRLYVSVHA
jgi:hypothetical protein